MSGSRGIATALAIGGLCCLGTLVACGGQPAGEPAGDRAMVTVDEILAAEADTLPSTEYLTRARATADGLGKELQVKLLAALDSLGPEGAVAVCADSAQAWSARHADDGVYVRRVSLRTRNPANRPDEVEERELFRLDSLHRAGALPAELVRARTMVTGDRVVEYMRPIVIQQQCLTCHGDRDGMAPAVRQLLSARYPADRAVGYSAGELRGMISVRIRP